MTLQRFVHSLKSNSGGGWALHDPSSIRTRGSKNISVCVLCIYHGLEGWRAAHQLLNALAEMRAKSFPSLSIGQNKLNSCYLQGVGESTWVFSEPHMSVSYSLKDSSAL